MPGVHVENRVCHPFDPLSPYQSEGLTERINEPPWGRCLQEAVDVRWVVVVVVVLLCCRRRPESPLAEL